jgi:beta-glucosidase/6-phospho-beta-glucosidase/beta-galactosidase
LLVPYPAVVPEAQGRRTVDFIGVNYYTKAYVQWRPRDAAAEHLSEAPVGLAFARRKEAASDLGWAVHPEGFRRMLRFAGRYGLPLYVTENGVADRDDDLRPRYLLSHLAQVARAISEDGLDIRGYYHWSLLDNFEWIKGFWPRFGLYQVDYDTFERKPTRSAELYRRIIDAHREEGRKPSLEVLAGIVDSPQVPIIARASSSVMKTL